MSEEPPGAQAAEDAPDPPSAASSVRTDLFGDVLPDQTSDDRPDRSDWRADDSDEGDRDDELRRDVPPHY